MSDATPPTTQACPSHRFVDPAGSIVVDALASLWGHDAEAAAQVETAPPADGLSVVPSRSGQPTASAVSPDGRRLQLHSKYDPIAEAFTLIERASPKSDGLAFIVLGFGLGYHVEELIKRIPTTARVWIIEDDVALIRAAIESRDLTELLANPRVRFITRIDRAKLLNDFQSLGPLISSGLTVIEHAPSVQRSPAFYADARIWIDEVQSYARTAVHTLVLNADKTIGNIARNLPWYATAPGPHRLQNAFKGEPAIIVSAGPSLRKNRHLLVEAKGKAVIIAVQTMLKPLLDLGIEPDFVTSLDYSPISARFFQNLPPNLKTELFAEAKATDALFHLHTGPLTLAGDVIADDLLRESVRPRARLRSGATVAHLAFYLAEWLGCDPIIFVGQDLGFSDGLCYTPGTSYDDVWRPEFGRFCTAEMKQWEQIARERPILRQVPDHRGRPMYTEQRLFTYLQQFERDFAVTSSKVIDASEGGAAKRGATNMTLREALDTYCTKPLRNVVPPHPGRLNTPLETVRDSLLKRIEEAEQMIEITDAVAPLLEEVRDHVGDHARVNRIIAKIDPLRDQMNTVGRTYDLVMYLGQRSEFDRFQSDLAIDGAANASPDERQRRQTERDLANVRAVRDSAKRFVTLMRDAIERVDAHTATEAA